MVRVDTEFVPDQSSGRSMVGTHIQVLNAATESLEGAQDGT